MYTPLTAAPKRVLYAHVRHHDSTPVLQAVAMMANRGTGYGTDMHAILGTYATLARCNYWWWCYCCCCFVFVLRNRKRRMKAQKHAGKLKNDKGYFRVSNTFINYWQPF